jgi:hypothetical protein
MEEPRYILDCYTKDSLEHGFPESTIKLVSPLQVAEYIANRTREMAGVEEIRVQIIKKEPDYEWAKYYRIESQIHRDYEIEFRKEVEEHLPSLGFMSFCGPKAIVEWIFKQVEIKKQT